MRSGLLSDLASIGYEIFLEGNNVRYRYQKAGNPPDKAERLIEELRNCKAEVVNILKMGNTIAPMEIIESETPSQTIWKNPFPIGSIEARRESLHQVMMAVWEKAFDSIAEIWPRGFVSTQEIHAAEIEVERVQALVLSGKGKLADFREAVEVWERTIKKEVNPPGLEKKKSI